MPLGTESDSNAHNSSKLDQNAQSASRRSENSGDSIPPWQHSELFAAFRSHLHANDLANNSFGLNPPVGELDHPVGSLCNCGIMGHHDDGQAPSMPL